MKKKALSSSKRILDALESIGIFTEEDVLKHLPRRYETYFLTPRKYKYEDKERLVKRGKLIGKPKMVRYAHRSLHHFYLETDEHETIHVEAWNRDYLSSILKEENEVWTVAGLYDAKNHCLSMASLIKGEVSEEDAIKPIYSLPMSLSNNDYYRIVKRSLISLEGKLYDFLPEEFRNKYSLLSYYDALRRVHCPKGREDVREALKRLKYEEALSFALKNMIIRGENKSLRRRISKDIDEEAIRLFIDSLPYKLTASQEISVKECLEDMESPSMMYRLLQGDVGTGKTLVAAILSYANYTRGKQSAIMAPTDSLARQHYENFKSIFKNTDIKISLLVGAMDGKEKSLAIQEIATGETDIVVGTHALFSKGVEYAGLGLVVIDEQHKFGVNQRTALLGKGDNADLLLMSATPIPRTLSLTLYGDMDVSILKDFPSQKRDVKTIVFDDSNVSYIDEINESINSGHRVYVVVPQIEDRGDSSTSVLSIYNRYKSLYPNKVVMMHGKMDEEEKNVAFLAFKTGLCPILVATSLIEVGIDVKEANLMIVYSPTHFSLSSLHQLRGRVGRDGTPSKFIMLYSEDELEESEKLKVLVSTDDGFKVAEADLKMRGPGEMAGLKQSGIPIFAYLNIVNDFKIFEIARNDAIKVLDNPKNEDYLPLLTEVRESLKE